MIVDSPPVLAVTDAVIVGQLCRIALMIARFSESAHKEVMISANRLRQNGVNLRGSILNAVEKRASGYYGYGGATTPTTTGILKPRTKPKSSKGVDVIQRDRLTEGRSYVNQSVNRHTVRGCFKSLSELKVDPLHRP